MNVECFAYFYFSAVRHLPFLEANMCQSPTSHLKTQQKSFTAPKFTNLSWRGIMSFISYTCVIFMAAFTLHFSWTEALKPTAL